MTTTFQRCDVREDPDWACFSLLFTGRTLDLAVAGGLQIHAWLLGLQHLISQHGVGSMPIISEGEFYRRKVQYKLMSAAHNDGLVLSRFLIMKVKEVGQPSGKGSAPGKPGGLGAGALVSGGPLAKPMQVFSPKKEKKDKKKDKDCRDCRDCTDCRDRGTSVGLWTLDGCHTLGLIIDFPSFILAGDRYPRPTFLVLVMVALCQ
eukprot:Skav228391  [mRNA]  locus=scaffold1911:54909:55520:+ [translate_table: standard]